MRTSQGWSFLLRLLPLRTPPPFYWFHIYMWIHRTLLRPISLSPFLYNLLFRQTKLLLSSSLQGIPLPTQTYPFPLDLTIPNTYSYETKVALPPGIWGRLRTDVILYNASGSKRLCIRWDVFANNRKTNDTSWLF